MKYLQQKEETCDKDTLGYLNTSIRCVRENNFLSSFIQSCMIFYNIVVRRGQLLNERNLLTFQKPEK